MLSPWRVTPSLTHPISATGRYVERLPDQLQENLRLVFVGTAASTRSAEAGHYYAHPGNRFWRTIHQVGLTPRLYQPREFPELLEFGIGFTDLCKSGGGMDHQALSFPVHPPPFGKKIWPNNPKPVPSTRKKAASLFYG